MGFGRAKGWVMEGVMKDGVKGGVRYRRGTECQDYKGI